MNFSFKSKCQGCKALKREGSTYVCGLGIVVQFGTVVEAGVNKGNPLPVHPVPMAKCYKPKSDKDYNSIRKQLKEKAKQEA